MLHFGLGDLDLAEGIPAMAPPSSGNRSINCFVTITGCASLKLADDCCAFSPPATAPSRTGVPTTQGQCIARWRTQGRRVSFRKPGFRQRSRHIRFQFIDVYAERMRTLATLNHYVYGPDDLDYKKRSIKFTSPFVLAIRHISGVKVAYPLTYLIGLSVHPKVIRSLVAFSCHP